MEYPIEIYSSGLFVLHLPLLKNLTAKSPSTGLFDPPLQTWKNWRNDGHTERKKKYRSTHCHSLDILDDLQGNVLQATPQLSHLCAQRGHTVQHLIQLVPELHLLLWGQALHHFLHGCQSLLLSLLHCGRQDMLFRWVWIFSVLFK